MYNRFYNGKYKNVFYENRWWRLYNELETTSFDAFYSELQIKLIEFIEKYNFKIFYFNCAPITDLKLIINNDEIDLNNLDIKKIKELQSIDLFYFFEKKICNVFYSFLKKDKNNNYYFDFMLVVNNTFNPQSLYKHQFNLIKVVNSKEVSIDDLTFDFIKNIYESRVNVFNNTAPCNDENCYELCKLNYGLQKFKEDFYPGIDEFEIDIDLYHNFNTFYYEKQFNQILYLKNCFKLVCSHIWSSDKKYYIEKNKFGLRLMYNNEYDLNSLFLTNFAEIVGCSSVNTSNNEVNMKKEYYTYCCLLDNLNDQGICLNFFDINNTNFNDFDFNTLKIVEEN